MEQNGGKVFGYISRELYDRHTRTLYRGEEIEFQTRKMSKTTNTLYLTDNQGVPIAISSPISGNHHDLYGIDCHLDELLQTLDKTNNCNQWIICQCRCRLRFKRVQK